jgi:NDP-sugar pyrophosphorylase family protein
MTDGLGAMVLASGEGRRLRPMTEDVPKPLLRILGQTLLDRALDKIAAKRPHRVVVALHHRADVAISHLAAGFHQVVAKDEKEMTGSAGAVRCCGNDPGLRLLLIDSGDLLFEDDLGGLLAHHRATAKMTFATRRVRQASRFGVLQADPDGRVVLAREKPPVPDDEVHLVSAGIYCLSPLAVRAIPSGATMSGGRPFQTGDGSTYVSNRATVGVGVTFRCHNAVLGSARIGDGSMVADSVVIEGVVMPARSALSGALACCPEPEERPRT